jgi:hypothetical protein
MSDTTQSPPDLSLPKLSARWGQDRRLAFIDFRLCWDGRINRSDLTRFFGISVPQASLDLARYQEEAPSNLSYDRRSRAYLVTEDFHPVRAENQPQRYLNELLASEIGVLDKNVSFIGWRPPVGFTPQPERVVESSTLAALLKAIREGSSLKVLYQSMSRLEPSERIISPHALGNDGFRWHVRAYCHTRKDFRDFVLGRILKVLKIEMPSVPADGDTQWHTILTLVLAPNPGLAEAKRRVIELDYGMEDGEISLTCRHALLYYTLRRLGLNNEKQYSPEQQQIVLKNREELAPLLQEM